MWRDPFNQNSNRSDREKWSTSKDGPVFSKLFRLDRTDPLSFGPKFPEILVEWIAPHGLFVFPPKKTLIRRRHCSISQSCCSMASKRSIDWFLWFLESSRVSERSLDQPKATRVCIRSLNQSNRSISVRLLFLFCSRVFISGSTKTALTKTSVFNTNDIFCPSSSKIQWNSDLRPPRYYTVTFSWPPGKTVIHFLVKMTSLIRSPVNTAKLFWPTGDRIKGVPLYVEKNLDLTKPRYSEQILPVPWPFVI